MASASIRNPVLETNLDRLSRYGYRRGAAGPETASATEWARLKGDFADAGQAVVADFDALPADANAAAQRYLDLRREADRLLSACEAAHKTILEQGLNVDRVEHYALVRDAYEEKVEEFGAARLAVSRLLARS